MPKSGTRQVHQIRRRAEQVITQSKDKAQRASNPDFARKKFRLEALRTFAAPGLYSFPDFDSLKIPFFLRSDNQYIVKSADFSG